MVTGTAYLRKQLNAVPNRIIVEVRRELEAVAAELVAQMQAVVPDQTGALKKSIGWTWGEVPKGALSIGTVSEGRLAIKIYAGTRDKSLGASDAFYARFVEFGTQNAAAQPYFWPVYRANRTRIRTRINAGIRRGLKSKPAAG